MILYNSKTLTNYCSYASTTLSISGEHEWFDRQERFKNRKNNSDVPRIIKKINWDRKGLTLTKKIIKIYKKKTI